jgi:site-specific recombinase XerC
MRWRARYLDDDGRRRAKGFAPQLGRTEVARLRNHGEIRNGNCIEPSAGRVTVATVYQSWFPTQAHISAKTASSRRSAWNSRVEPKWGDTLIADVRPAAIRAWGAAMVDDGAGTPTIENAFGVLRQPLGAAVEDSRVPRNPCDGVRHPKRKHSDRGYVSHEQVAALASAVGRQGEGVRFLTFTGLWWGEIAVLRVQDFDMLRRRVNVSRSVTESGGLVWSTPKSWERRSVPFRQRCATNWRR